jgi:hypothetical protein
MAHINSFWLRLIRRRRSLKIHFPTSGGECPRQTCGLSRIPCPSDIIQASLVITSYAPLAGGRVKHTYNCVLTGRMKRVDCTSGCRHTLDSQSPTHTPDVMQNVERLTFWAQEVCCTGATSSPGWLGMHLTLCAGCGGMLWQSYFFELLAAHSAEPGKRRCY